MTSSQSRSLTMENTMIKETLFNEEFIGYINSLSKAILDFYKVSTNIHSNKDLLINYGKNELINSNNLINANNDLNSVLIELTQSLNEIFNKLDFNNKSQENNLSNFFADAKILFKRLREKRQEILSKMQSYTQRGKNSDFPNSLKNSINKRNKTLDHPMNTDMTAKSFHNINLDKMENVSDFSKNKSVNLTEENGMKLDDKRTKSQHRQRMLINEQYFNNENNTGVNAISEFGIKKPTLNMNNINNNNFNNINKKHLIILNKYKKDLSIFMNENKQLKDSIEQLKSNNNNMQNNFSTNIGQKLTLLENLNNNNNKENNALRNKIKILENKFRQKQAENNELNKKMILLKQQYESNAQEMNLMNINGQQRTNFDLNDPNINKKISALNENIKEKDNKLLDMNYQLEQIKSQYLSKENENKKLLKLIENMKMNKEKNVMNNNSINALNEKLEEQQNLNNDLNEELIKVKNDNELLKKKILSNEKRISLLKNNEDTQKEFDKLKNENKSLKFENEKLNFTYNQQKGSLMSNNEDKVKKQEDEIEGLKQLIQKIQTEREALDKENSSLKKENEKVKNQMMKLSKKLPEEYNELQTQYDELQNKYNSLKNKNISGATPKKTKVEEKPDYNKLVKELAEAKKEIEQLKKKNVELVSQLEDKEINKNYYDTRSEDANKSNYEEEFDLRRMAKGAKDKNRSQDINIDYPGILTYKEKLRELEFYYNSLETLVKKLLLTIQCNPKNKTYVTELCRIVGFDLETTNKIVNNKNKNFILGLFSK